MLGLRTCVCCRAAKPTESFSKNQRTKGDRAKCKCCTEHPQKKPADGTGKFEGNKDIPKKKNRRSDDRSTSSDAEESSNPSKKKKRKDPNAPKRPFSSFMCFSLARRPVIKKENPDITFGAMAKRLGADFKEISEEERKKFEAMAAEDKVRYTIEMKSYIPPSYEEPPKPKRKKGPKKDVNAPKGAKSAFIYFGMAVRKKLGQENPNLSFEDIGKMVGAAYKNLTDEEKKEYQEKGDEDRRRYTKEIAAYRKEIPCREADEEGGSTPPEKKDEQRLVGKETTEEGVFIVQ